MSVELKKKMKKIKLLVLDVDGVMTNGKININDLGQELKVFDVQDGFGIKMFHRFVGDVAILSARSTPSVTARAEDLQIDKVYQGAYPKLAVFEKCCKYFKLKPQEVCFIGDDLLDVNVIKKVGFGVAVKNASKQTKLAADYVTKRAGGDGAIREVIEMILKAQNQWKAALEHYC